LESSESHLATTRIKLRSSSVVFFRMTIKRTTNQCEAGAAAW
jgi:hypothetical protein